MCGLYGAFCIGVALIVTVSTALRNRLEQHGQTNKFGDPGVLVALSNNSLAVFEVMLGVGVGSAVLSPSTCGASLLVQLCKLKHNLIVVAN